MPSADTVEDLKHLRVDQVGGLAAPPELRRLFDDYKSGKASEAALDRAKDEAVRHVIARQEAIGFPILTDGELRRRNFQESFSESVSGFDVPAEDKSMEGVSLQPFARAPSRISVRRARRSGRGGTLSSACALPATCRCRNTNSRASSRPSRSK